MRALGHAVCGACGLLGMRAVMKWALGHVVIFCYPDREPCEDRLCLFAYLLPPHPLKQVIILLVALV